MTTLVLGPSLGTTVAACWGPTIGLLPAGLQVVALELPGHRSTPDSPASVSATVSARVSIADLAAQALELVEGPFVYAGDSVGGQVGLQLLLDAPDRVLGAVLCCTGAKIGTEQTWMDRIAAVRSGGTAGLLDATRERWFAPGFVDREPEVADALLAALADNTDEGYIAVCGALAEFDVHDRLGEIAAPVLAVGGAADAVCPPDSLREIAEGVRRGRLVVLDRVAHQAPAEAPGEVARMIRELVEEVR